VYWKPVYAILEGELGIVVANAQHIKGARAKELKLTSTAQDPGSQLWPLGGGSCSRTQNTPA